jgi:hypothetical protein
LNGTYLLLGYSSCLGEVTIPPKARVDFDGTKPKDGLLWRESEKPPIPKLLILKN